MRAPPEFIELQACRQFTKAHTLPPIGSLNESGGPAAVLTSTRLVWRERPTATRWQRCLEGRLRSGSVCRPDLPVSSRPASALNPTQRRSRRPTSRGSREESTRLARSGYAAYSTTWAATSDWRDLRDTEPRIPTRCAVGDDCRRDSPTPDPARSRDEASEPTRASALLSLG
jgi:hypothetical protein